MKKKAPQDATRVNVQAANKKFALLAEKIKNLEWRVKVLEGTLMKQDDKLLALTQRD